MRHRRFFDIIEPMCSSTLGLQMKPLLVYFRGWVQKLFNCKGWKVVKVMASTATAPPFLSYLWTPTHQMQHSNRTSPSTSAYTSMRHRRFFDIIEPMCSSTLGLQMKPLLVYFRGWVQKLFNCKGWKVVLEAARPGGNRAVLPILSMGPLLIKKYFFEKISTGTLVCA